MIGTYPTDTPPALWPPLGALRHDLLHAHHVQRGDAHALRRGQGADA